MHLINDSIISYSSANQHIYLFSAGLLGCDKQVCYSRLPYAGVAPATKRARTAWVCGRATDPGPATAAADTSPAAGVASAGPSGQQHVGGLGTAPHLPLAGPRTELAGPGPALSSARLVALFPAYGDGLPRRQHRPQRRRPTQHGRGPELRVAAYSCAKSAPSATNRKGSPRALKPASIPTTSWVAPRLIFYPGALPPVG
jgi:hypothetical protein